MHEQSERIERPRKPRKCPVCEHAPVATIIYGYVVGPFRLRGEDLPRDKLWHDIETGRAILGGCVIEDDSPAWQCTACSAEMYRTAKD